MKRKFNMPTKSDLKGRSSTISNAFAIAITPFIPPKEEELDAYYSELEIEEGQCVYCLGDGNGKDHLKPLVDDGMPTGNITDIHNIVPCCQRCNSSKGAKSFREWYKSPQNVERLKKLGLTDETIESRYRIVCKYEDKIPEPLNYEELVGTELWEQYKNRRLALLESLNENQEFCDKLYKIIEAKRKR